MSFTNPAHQIARQSVVGVEGLWAKMFDPPTDSPDTPDLMTPTNPVPEVMALAGFQDTPSEPHVVQRDLMHGQDLPTWDDPQHKLSFMLIRDADNDLAAGTFPGPIVRVPRGAIFHADSQGHGPPPHTIHWHGIEPTPMNDGVGHCSMEIGSYIYQWQPNFIGFYFYHCHRNTVQHFEFGLYSALFVETPDAYFASLNADGTLNLAIPIGAGRDGLRRIATNLLLLRGPTNPGDPSSYVAGSGHGFEGPLVFPTLEDVQAEYPGFNNNPITAPDPEADNPEVPAHLKFPVDPHAMTVPYDVEVFWNPDDRDSKWSEEAKNARATYPRHGDIPGVNDNFAGNAGGGVGPDDFFAFNDFRPDYFYVTGVPVPAHVGEVGTLAPGSTIPGFLNGGIVGTQVAVQAQVGQTILLRALNAAYVCVTYTLPVDAIIIAWDGRSLGVPPFAESNHPYLVPAGTPIHASVARRFDALIKSDVEVHGFATIEFVDTRGQLPGEDPTVLVTAQIPFDIGAVPPPGEAYSISGKIEYDYGGPMAHTQVTIAPHSLGGSPLQIVMTDANGFYIAEGLTNGMYQIMPHAEGFTFEPAVNRDAVLLDVTIQGANITDQDFIAIPAAEVGFRIRGTIVDGLGDEVEGIEVTVSPRSVGASPEQTVLTDNNGRYQFDNLANGDYRIRPDMDGFEFTPDRIDVMVMDADVNVQDIVATAVVLPAAPTPPTALTVVAVDGTGITLGWADNSDNEQGFYIERRTLGDIPTAWARIATVEPDKRRFKDRDVSGQTRYRYRAQAFNAGGVSAYSNVVTASAVSAPIAVPAAPTGLRVISRVSGTLTLGWADKSGNEQGFYIERRITGVAPTPWVRIGTRDANARRYADRNFAALPPSGQYRYRVQAFNADGVSEYSNVLVVSP